MYASIYFFRVPVDRLDAFLRIQREAAEIELGYGALEDATFLAANLERKYGLAGFSDVIPLRRDEVLAIEVARFRDLAHHDAVMARVDVDPRIEALYEELTGLLDVRRLLRGEFERVI
jgi:uncharacterized protein YbaA (DUF1428 family)